MNNYTFNCTICGRFISYRKSYYVWTPYGSSNSIEPPDEEYAHKECYEKQDISLIERTSWIKPYYINNLKLERKEKLKKINADSSVK